MLRRLGTANGLAGFESTDYLSIWRVFDDSKPLSQKANAQMRIIS